MSEGRSRSSMVEIAADPLTASSVYRGARPVVGPGPINAYDSARLVEMRCEPELGGRILEVYDAETGDGLELARITVWEPGRRLAWESSLDDVTIEVQFEPTPTGASFASRRRLRWAARIGAARHSSRCQPHGSLPG